MKISQICAVAMLLVVGSVLAFAGGIHDPRIIIHGVNGGNSPCGRDGCKQVGVDFTFSSPKSGSGFLFFTNASGKNWTSLTLIEAKQPNMVQANDISCSQTLFLSCSVKTLKNGSVEILLSGVKHGLNPHYGILAGQSFSIGFGCVGDSCWPKSALNFSAHAGTVPEPGTVALMVTGLGAMFSRRKVWLNRLKA
jgi:hypothetical protein